MTSAGGRGSGPGSSGSYLISILRAFKEQSEVEKPYVPVIGGPRLFVLVLYVSVLIAVSLEFFAHQNIWYGSWEVYNTYVFSVSGIFVLLGMVMLFYPRRTPPDGYILPIPRVHLGVLGFFMLFISGIALAVWNKDLGGWAIPLSIILLYGFVVMVISSRSVDPREGYRLVLYGTGLVLMILVPVHEAFNYYRTADPDKFLWNLPNLILFASGMVVALFGAQALRTRDGFLGAWLMGAMAIFLISFHEQLGIVASGDYSPYDRMLAVIGVTFSFLPLAMYVWRERVYIFLWRRLRTANSLIDSGDYGGGLKNADEALKQCYQAGIEDKFPLPWTLKADAQYRMKDYPKARVNYETALAIDPRDSVSWCHLGNMHAFEGRYDDAIRAYDEALKYDPSNSYAWNNKGTVYQVLHMDEQALIAFNKALQNNPNDFDAHINIAKLLSKMGHSEEALPHYRAALRIRPDSEAARQGVKREYYRLMCLDQLRGWEQLGLDTSQLRGMLDQDPSFFARKSREWLKNLIDQRSQLPVVPAKEHIDVNAAVDTILKAAAPPGATLTKLKEATRLSERDLVLPLALLMETEHIFFKTDGKRQFYVARGKSPAFSSEEEIEPEPEPEPEPVREVEREPELVIERPPEYEVKLPPRPEPKIEEKPEPRPEPVTERLTELESELKAEPAAALEPKPEPVFERPPEVKPEPREIPAPEPKPIAEPVVPKEEKRPPAPVKPPVFQVKCPGCGVPLRGDEARCPMCDLPLEKAAFDCPICGEDVMFYDETCPKCGAMFRGIPAQRIGAARPAPRPAAEPTPAVKEKALPAQVQKPAPKVEPSPVIREEIRVEAKPQPWPELKIEPKLQPKAEVKKAAKEEREEKKKAEKKAKEKAREKPKAEPKPEPKPEPKRLLPMKESKPEPPKPKRALPPPPPEPEKKKPVERLDMKVEPAVSILVFKRKKK